MQDLIFINGIPVEREKTIMNFLLSSQNKISSKFAKSYNALIPYR